MQIEKVLNNNLLTKENYRTFSMEGEIVISASSLSYIDPNQGGSMLRFKGFLEGEKGEESPSLENGKIVHKYAESPKDFVVAPEDLPGEKMVEVVENAYRMVKESGIAFGQLSEHQEIIVQGAAEAGFQKKWGSNAIITNVIKEGSDYYKFLVDGTDKVMLKAAQKEILEGIKTSIENSPEREFIFDMKPINTEEVFFDKEVPILFKLNGLYAKSLLDNLFIDHNKKLVVIRDIKTTSKPVSQYLGYLVPQRGFDGSIGMMYENGPFQYYRTYRQLSFYQLAASTLLPFNGRDYNFLFKIDACETIKPYEYRCYDIPPQWVMFGRKEIEAGTTLVQQYIEKNKLNKF